MGLCSTFDVRAAVRRRCQAVDAPELLGEVLLAVVPGTHCDLADEQAAFDEKTRGIGDTRLAYQVARRRRSQLAEFAAELTDGDVVELASEVFYANRDSFILCAGSRAPAMDAGVCTEALALAPFVGDGVI